MIISSRTPEGQPYRCPLCGRETALEPSYQGDVPCPSCGHLLWWFRDRLGHSTSLSPEMIALDSAFVADLGKDSLDHIELLLEIEEDFGVSIPDEVAETIQTVEDAIRYIVTHRRAA